MPSGEIHIRFITGITPDVVADGRVHVLTGGVQIFLVAFDLVDEGSFRDRYANVILLPALLCRWRWRIARERAHMTDRLLPQFTVRSARTFAQISELFVCNINARVDAHQLRTQSGLARSHQLKERMLAFE